MAAAGVSQCIFILPAALIIINLFITDEEFRLRKYYFDFTRRNFE